MPSLLLLYNVQEPICINYSSSFKFTQTFESCVILSNNDIEDKIFLLLEDDSNSEAFYLLLKQIFYIDKDNSADSRGASTFRGLFGADAGGSDNKKSPKSPNRKEVEKSKPTVRSYENKDFFSSSFIRESKYSEIHPNNGAYLEPLIRTKNSSISPQPSYYISKPGINIFPVKRPTIFLGVVV